MNRVIKTFGHDGEFLDDSVAMISRVAAENAVIHEMRDKGYARVLDLDVGWFTQYDPHADKWEYAIRVYGIYVGKRKARDNQGWSQGKLIPRSTRQLM
jgi:roadblock/LC7 domain-containing protein